MPRSCGRAALIIATPRRVPRVPFFVTAEVSGECWLSANDGHPGLADLLIGLPELCWAVASNGLRRVHGALPDPTRTPHMPLPVVGRLIWRKARRTSHQGD
jgi:hypothetical protein